MDIVNDTFDIVKLNLVPDHAIKVSIEALEEDNDKAKGWWKEGSLMIDLKIWVKTLTNLGNSKNLNLDVSNNVRSRATKIKGWN